MNLLRAGGNPRFMSRASGFLDSEACTPHGIASSVDLTLAQTSLRAITGKAGNRDCSRAES